ncbi:MAG: WG repeat-containing protein [Spirochaetales bacterium]|nr:WG repeat-containing protein [Spirochaetales bacterium]
MIKNTVLTAVSLLIIFFMPWGCVTTTHEQEGGPQSGVFYAKIDPAEREKAAEVIDDALKTADESPEKFRESLLKELDKTTQIAGAANKQKMAAQMNENIKNALDRKDFGEDDKKSVVKLLSEYRKYLKDGDKTTLKIRVDGKYGFINAFGEVLVPPVLDGSDTGRYNAGFIWVKGNPSYVVLNDKLETIFESDSRHFDKLNLYSEGLAQFTEQGKAGFIDESGRIVIGAVYEDAENFSGGLAAVKLNNNWGFIDKKGKMVIEAEYHSVSSFDHGFATAGKNNKYGVIDPKGNFLLKMDYDSVYLEDGFSLLMLDGKHGVFDLAGRKMIYAVEYDDLEHWGKNFKVKENGQYFLGDEQGNIKSWGYDTITLSKGAYFIVIKRYRKGVIDRTGKLILDFDDYTELTIAPGEEKYIVGKLRDETVYLVYDINGVLIKTLNYDDVQPLKQGFKVKKNGKYGLLDNSFNETITCKYDYILEFYNGLYEVQKNGRYGCVDISGKSIIDIGYDYFVDIGGKYIKTSLKQRFGIMDYEGNTLIPPTYESILTYGSSGPFVCKKPDTFRFYDVAVKKMLPDTYGYISDFETGFLANKDSKMALLDQSLKNILPFAYDSINEYKGGRYRVQLNGLWGIVDKKNNLILDIQYSSIDTVPDNRTSLSDGFYITMFEGYEGYDKIIMIKQGDKWGFLDQRDKMLIKPRFDDVAQFSDNALRVKENGKWGLLDSGNGKILLKPAFDTLADIYDGTAIATIGPKNANPDWFAIGEKGEQLFAFDATIQEVFTMVQGYCIVKEFSGGYLDENGDQVSLYDYSVFDSRNKTRTLLDDLDDLRGSHYTFSTVLYHGGLSVVKGSGKWGVAGLRGQMYMDFELDDKINFKYENNRLEEHAIFKKDGRLGLVNKDYQVIAQPLYQEMQEFSDKFYNAKRDGFWYLVSIDTGEETAGPYKAISTFLIDKDKKELSVQGVNNMYGFIDPEGKLIIEPRFNQVTGFSSVIAGYKKDNKWGVFDITDTVLTEPLYDNVSTVTDGIIKYNIENRIGYLNIMGMKIYEIWSATN